MLKILQLIFLFFLFLFVAFCTAWGSLALWFKLPWPDLVKWCVIGAFSGIGLATLVAFFKSVRWRWLIVFTLPMVAIVGWWNTLVPPAQGDFPPEVARQFTGKIEGDTLTLQNVRAFEWKTTEDYTEKWVTRTYNLSQIVSVDMFLSFWSGPNIGHFMLSFGFEDGQYLALSNEVRRLKGGSFSPLADFFKANPIIMIASEETDVVGLRSNIRGERVQIFRIKSDQAQQRAFVEAYVTAANKLAKKPVWFNSVFQNCSSSDVTLARLVGADLPLDWRLVVNGYMPEYLYERDAMNSTVLSKIYFLLGNITKHANNSGLTNAYSAAIREGVPTP